MVPMYVLYYHINVAGNPTGISAAIPCHNMETLRVRVKLLRQNYGSALEHCIYFTPEGKINAEGELERF